MFGSQNSIPKSTFFDWILSSDTGAGVKVKVIVFHTDVLSNISVKTEIKPGPKRTEVGIQMHSGLN